MAFLRQCNIDRSFEYFNVDIIIIGSLRASDPEKLQDP